MILGPEDDQLLMLVIGHGGVGKSVLIDAITETFEFHEQEAALAKCATSGVAASNISGQIIHSWAGLGIHRPKAPDWVQKAGQKTVLKRKRNILGKKCLLIDEMSMLDDTLLSDVAEVHSIFRKTARRRGQQLPTV